MSSSVQRRSLEVQDAEAPPGGSEGAATGAHVAIDVLEQRGGGGGGGVGAAGAASLLVFGAAVHTCSSKCTPTAAQKEVAIELSRLESWPAACLPAGVAAPALEAVPEHGREGEEAEEGDEGGGRGDAKAAPSG